MTKWERFGIVTEHFGESTEGEGKAARRPASFRKKCLTRAKTCGNINEFASAGRLCQAKENLEKALDKNLKMW